MDTHLPADQFAQEVRTLIAQGGVILEALAHSIGVHPTWLRKVVTGEITDLTLLTVVGICRRLRLMPEDIWDPDIVARAFSGSRPLPSTPDDEA